MHACSLVPGAGIEPARLAAGDFESPASTNFTTRAGGSRLGRYGTKTVIIRWKINFQKSTVSRQVLWGRALVRDIPES